MVANESPHKPSCEKYPEPGRKRRTHGQEIGVCVDTGKEDEWKLFDMQRGAWLDWRFRVANKIFMNFY